MSRDESLAAIAREPDHMGAWSDGGDIVWLPRSLYPKRSGAIAWAVAEWGVTWPEVRCTTVWMRYEPFADGEDRWHELEDGHMPDAFRADAFRAWRLEAA